MLKPINKQKVLQSLGCVRPVFKTENGFVFIHQIKKTSLVVQFEDRPQSLQLPIP
jgi:hypothetical protein